ncbi:hypothetical protein DITRI_Ditri08aG0052300 [Diplodiscus trichospermus]
MEKDKVKKIEEDAMEFKDCEEREMEFKDCEEREMEFQDCEEEKEDKIEISDEIERSKVGIMRAFVEREDPSAKNVDDLMIRRFLRARDLDIEKASTMFLKYLSWRRTFVPKGFISESEISSQLAHNKLFMQGLDKQGRPVVVTFGGRHKPTKGNVEEVKQCQKDRKSLWQLEILKDGDTRVVTFVLIWHLYQSCRTAIQRDLPSYLLFMCPTYL